MALLHCGSGGDSSTIVAHAVPIILRHIQTDTADCPFWNANIQEHDTNDVEWLIAVTAWLQHHQWIRGLSQFSTQGLIVPGRWSYMFSTAPSVCYRTVFTIHCPYYGNTLRGLLTCVLDYYRRYYCCTSSLPTCDNATHMAASSSPAYQADVSLNNTISSSRRSICDENNNNTPTSTPTTTLRTTTAGVSATTTMALDDYGNADKRGSGGVQDYDFSMTRYERTIGSICVERPTQERLRYT